MAGESIEPGAGLPDELRELSTTFAVGDDEMRAAAFYNLLQIAAGALAERAEADEVVDVYKDEAKAAKDGEQKTRQRLGELATQNEELRRQLDIANTRAAEAQSRTERESSQKQDVQDLYDRLWNEWSHHVCAVEDLERRDTLQVLATLNDGTRLWGERPTDDQHIAVALNRAAGFVAFGLIHPDIEEVQADIVVTRIPKRKT